ncbi:unnamed protein product, partial [Didymodactylos carnosus]
MCFVRGRSRHPQSQGCIERANVKEKNILDEDDLPGNIEEIDETPAEKNNSDLLNLDDELDTPVVNEANEKEANENHA